MDGQYIIQQARDEEEDDGPRDGELREQDRFLPIYNISKVMKKVVPQSGKVAKEARITNFKRYTAGQAAGAFFSPIQFNGTQNTTG